MKPQKGEFWIVEDGGKVTVGQASDDSGFFNIVGSDMEGKPQRAVRKVDVGALLDQPAGGPAQRHAGNNVDCSTEGGLIERLQRCIDRLEAANPLPKPYDFYYANKNDGEGTGWRYACVGMGISDLKEAVSALSVLPAEREDLKLEWRDGAPEKHWAKEWFIAETTYGDRVVLTALPEEWTYDFKTADDTYIKRDKIKRWMQFPDSSYVAPDRQSPAEKGGEEIVFWYKNHRGEEGYRRVRPIGLRWGSSEWHKTPQWLLLARDLEKNCDREFALADARHVVGGAVVGPVVVAGTVTPFASQPSPQPAPSPAASGADIERAFTVDPRK